MVQNTQKIRAGQTYCVYLKGKACGGAFLDKYCHRFFILRLFNGLKPFQVELHSYTLLANEVYLLVTPTSSTGLDCLIRSVRNSYTKYFQERYERESSPLAKSMSVSRVVGSQLILDCQKYIERRVLDTGIRQHAGAYEWSSYSANSFGCRSGFVSPHVTFVNYLKERESPYKHYREYISTPFMGNYLSFIDSKVRSGKDLTRRRVPLTSPIVKKRIVKKRIVKKRPVKALIGAKGVIDKQRATESKSGSQGALI